MEHLLTWLKNKYCFMILNPAQTPTHQQQHVPPKREQNCGKYFDYSWRAACSPSKAV